MNTEADEMPSHSDGCDGTELDGPCAACRWLRECDLDYAAWLRFQELLRCIPFDSFRPQGMGRG